MMFNFDSVFHKEINKLSSQDCPCSKCNESRFYINNPYYQSIQCEQCDKYKQYKKNNEMRSE